MESVVATVSGYHGSERFNLIKLISQSGASYVGAMNPSTTHLVCQKFEGQKYELAKKFKTLIVNHRWVEECAKQGWRVPERPYTKKCGQQVGPLLLEIPVVADKLTSLLPQPSSASNIFREPVIDIDCEESGDDVWTDSWLLKENIFPELGRNKDCANKVKRKGIKRSSRHNLSPPRYCFDEPPSPGCERVESEDLSSPSPTRLVRQRRRSSTTAEPSRKGRRLVKKNSSSGSEHEAHPVQINHQNDDVAAPPEHSTGGSIESNGSYNHEERGTDNLDEGAKSCVVRNPQDHSSAADGGLNEIEHNPKLSTSPELSCVICWTDFSSTRGVLPCGHRFCFSCIQNWADQLASMRKISTCPLCKGRFESITKVDDAVSSDQKIYSQTIPCNPSAKDVCILSHGEAPSHGARPVLDRICYQCCHREPEDLLMECQLCEIRFVHIYCLDPPQSPWTCTNCKDLRRLYHHVRYFTST